MFKTGLIALVGRPNVGKSTLLNALVGQKVSIVSNKAQTTRRRAMGIDRGPDHEICFVDTPGIHEPHTKLGRAMIEEARQALADADMILFVVDVSKMPSDLDQQIAHLIKGVSDVFLCFNKMDKLKPENVQRHVDAYCKLAGTDDYMMTRATTQTNLDKLRTELLHRLPEGEPQFDEDSFTDQSTRFMVSELIREQVLNITREEVPHAVAVLIEDWDETTDPWTISAVILVEKQGQKAILIGNRGETIKKIGSQARPEIESLLGRRVFLDLIVRAKDNWRMNVATVRLVQGEEV